MNKLRFAPRIYPTTAIGVAPVGHDAGRFRYHERSDAIMNGHGKDGGNGQHEWYICRACQKFTLEVNEYWMCSRCSNGDRAPAPVMFASIMFHIAPISYSSSRVLDEKQWRKIVKQVNDFYKYIAPAERGMWNMRVAEQKSRSRIVEAKEGHIYLILAETGYYKIGRTYDVEMRLSQHEMDYPMEMRVLHSFRSTDVKHDERRLLNAFKSKQLRGEWFELSGHDVAWFKSIEDFSMSIAFMKFKERKRLFKVEKTKREKTALDSVRTEIGKVARRVRALWG